MSEEEVNQWKVKKRDWYLKQSRPPQIIGDPSPEVIKKLKAEGGTFTAGPGKYEGRVISLTADGRVQVN